MKKSILNAINSINSTDEMNEVIELIKIKQKQLRAIKTQGVKSKLSIGTKVKFENNDGITTHGEVTKIKRTKAVVRVDGLLWNCPLGMLEVA
jgi:hypothetical protein